MSFSENHYHDPSSSSFEQRVDIKTGIETLLSTGEESVDWNSINHLLLKLTPSTATNAFTSSEDDPMGRLILGHLISRKPPLASLKTFLKVFPDSLLHNPAAYFIACRHNLPMETMAEMMRHTIQRTPTNNEECPYPWIVSDLMTVEAVQAILQVYPQGVLQGSTLLSNLCPLDFFLRSTGVIETRVFDHVMWSKFKLVLVAAQCNDQDSASFHDISPVHTILKRILSYSGMYETGQDYYVDQNRWLYISQIFDCSSQTFSIICT